MEATHTNPSREEMRLFIACFVALMTTAFGFILRALTLPQWGEDFDLTNTYTNNIFLIETYVTEDKQSIFGDYRALDANKLTGATPQEKQTVQSIQEDAKKGALKTVALFPIIMLVSYCLLIIYFKSRGGYKVMVLNEIIPKH